MVGRANKQKTPRPVTCKKATALLAGYVGGILSPELGTAFEAHLRACPDCLSFLNTYRKTMVLVKNFLAENSAGDDLDEIRGYLVKKLKTRRAAS
jgi:hypothetical protein